MHTIMRLIHDSSHTPYLCVLKLFGTENNNYLSFPVKGLTLAVDFKIKQGLFDFLDELDKVVIANGGKIYLAKDARMREETFKNSYSDWEKFMQIRNETGASKKFRSLLSERLGI